MPYSPESQKPSTEPEVLDGARHYANARRRTEVLHRKRTLAIEAERLADCDFHDASNERFSANLKAGDRAMGFTTFREYNNCCATKQQISIKVAQRNVR